MLDLGNKDVSPKRQRLHNINIKNELRNQFSLKFLSLEQNLKNNLFVYNEQSFPAKIRKQIRAKITHSPEVVATLLKETTVKNKIKTKVKHLRVLLDSGGSANLIQKRHVGQNFKLLDSKGPVTWTTANGKFRTTKIVVPEFQLPEFDERVTIKQPFHVCDHDLGYDMIIGRETLAELGFIINFKTNQISWNDIKVAMKDPTLFDKKEILTMFALMAEPDICRKSLNRAIKIIDCGRTEPPNINDIVDNNNHLNDEQKVKLKHLLDEYKDLFDGSLGDWNTPPVSVELKPDAKPHHSRPYPVPQIHKEQFKKELDSLVELGVLEKDSGSQWAAPAFTIPKKDGSLRFLTDFRELNKRIIRRPYPLPKISEVLQELEGLSYATTLDLKMGYYTIRLDPDAQKLCTVITPWGKYKYLRMPMGIMSAPDIFQNRMSDLMAHLQFVKVYIDDLLMITKDSFEEHLAKLKQVLTTLQKAGLKCNLSKSFFCQEQVEYLGYLLTREGINPTPKKVQAILNLDTPNNVRKVRRVLGILQYYRDIWEK